MGVLRGHLDRADRRELAGWVQDTAQPQQPVALRILANGVLLARLVADRPRADLAAAGLGGGRCGFRLRIPHGLSPLTPQAIQIQRAADGREIPGSPVLLAAPAPASGAALHAWLEAALAAAGSATDAPAQARLARFLLARIDDLIAARPEQAAASGWPEVLAALRARAAGTTAPPAAAGARRALFLDQVVPTPDRDGGSNAAIGHIGALQRLGYEVTFVAAADMARRGGYTEALEAQGVRCCTSPAYASVEEVLRRHAGDFGLIYLHRLATAAQYGVLARTHCPRARLVYSVADLHFLRQQRQAAVEDRPDLAAHSQQTRLAECLAAAHADAVITHSPVEAELLRRAVPAARVHVVPWPLTPQPQRRPFAERHGIAFIAGYGHPPNRDAAHWLVRTILPLLRAHNPAIECLLVGSDLPPDIAALAGDGVIVLGHVADLATVFERVRLTVAPLRYGAGLKQKVVASLAAGLPCVCTPIAAEGLALPGALAAHVAGDAAGFARSVATLHDDAAQHAAAAEAGLRLIWRDFAAPRVDALLRAAVAGAG